MSIRLLMSLVGMNEPKAIVILTKTPNVVEVHVPEVSIPEISRILHDNVPIGTEFLFKPLASENQDHIRGPIFLDNRR